MPSLRELQHGFVAAVLDQDDGAPALAITPAEAAAERIAIYRRAAFANYRNALGATYPVVARLTGTPFFNAAVDAFVHDHPSTCGDLNVYGDAFAAFLSSYAPAATLPYLADVARLEWAIDEAGRAPDARRAPASVLAAFGAIAPDRLPALRVTLEPSCRLVASRYPILHLWQVNQTGYEGDDQREPGRRRAGAPRPSRRARHRARACAAGRIRVAFARWARALRSAPRSTPRWRPTPRSISASRSPRISPRARSPQ